MRIRMATPIVLTLLAATACTGAPRLPRSTSRCRVSLPKRQVPSQDGQGLASPRLINPSYTSTVCAATSSAWSSATRFTPPHWPTVGTRSFGSPRLGELHSRSTRHLMAPALLSIERLREDLAHRLSTCPRQAAGPSRCPGPGTRTNSPFRTRAHDYTPWNSPSDDGQGP